MRVKILLNYSRWKMIRRVNWQIDKQTELWGHFSDVRDNTKSQRGRKRDLLFRKFNILFGSEWGREEGDFVTLQVFLWKHPLALKKVRNIEKQNTKIALIVVQIFVKTKRPKFNFKTYFSSSPECGKGGRCQRVLPLSYRGGLL